MGIFDSFYTQGVHLDIKVLQVETVFAKKSNQFFLVSGGKLLECMKNKIAVYTKWQSSHSYSDILSSSFNGNGVFGNENVEDGEIQLDLRCKVYYFSSIYIFILR